MTNNSNEKNPLVPAPKLPIALYVISGILTCILALASNIFVKMLLNENTKISTFIIFVIILVILITYLFTATQAISKKVITYVCNKLGSPSTAELIQVEKLSNKYARIKVLKDNVPALTQTHEIDIDVNWVDTLEKLKDKHIPIKEYQGKIILDYVRIKEILDQSISDNCDFVELFTKSITPSKEKIGDCTTTFERKHPLERKYLLIETAIIALSLIFALIFARNLLAIIALVSVLLENVYLIFKEHKKPLVSVIQNTIMLYDTEFKLIDLIDAPSAIDEKNKYSAIVESKVTGKIIIRVPSNKDFQTLTSYKGKKVYLKTQNIKKHTFFYHPKITINMRKLDNKNQQ